MFELDVDVSSETAEPRTIKSCYFIAEPAGI